MELTWDILYRGPLDSCNFDCDYCPFRKREERALIRAEDEEKLTRFVGWARARRERKLNILFTPWGEALIHDRYQRALAELSWENHVGQVAIQTNLSGSLGWLDKANARQLAIWATWHPSQMSMARFLSQCEKLNRHGVSYSVGMVGLINVIEQMEDLRATLPRDIYLWINAYKDVPNYYNSESIRRISALDPHFPTNLKNHASRGRSCLAGESSFVVDGDGNVSRCHFVQGVIGNIYAEDPACFLSPRTCPKNHCGCHLGYIHLPHLRLRETFGANLLSRIPLRPSVPAAAALLPV